MDAWAFARSLPDLAWLCGSPGRRRAINGSREPIGKEFPFNDGGRGAGNRLRSFGAGAGRKRGARLFSCCPRVLRRRRLRISVCELVRNLHGEREFCARENAASGRFDRLAGARWNRRESREAQFLQSGQHGTRDSVLRRTVLEMARKTAILPLQGCGCRHFERKETFAAATQLKSDESTPRSGGPRRVTSGRDVRKDSKYLWPSDSCDSGCSRRDR